MLADVCTCMSLLTVCLCLMQHARSQDLSFTSIFPALMRRQRISMKEPCDSDSRKEEYDFIVVGAGAAGCVLANRLTEVDDWEVLLLEAGGEEAEIMDIPFLTGQFERTEADWQYRSVPSDYSTGLVGNQIPYPSGKVSGGSTILNNMIYSRGSPQDYNNWEDLGNTGWNFSSVLPYFLKMENMQIPELTDSDVHSTSGNMKISYSPYTSDITYLILEGGREMGENITDYNGLFPRGFSFIQRYMENGSRWSASQGYLHPIRYRKNFTYKKRSIVTRILIDSNKRATGVEFVRNGERFRVRARKEVILSAGAIASPQLLMLSGVGPQEHLSDLGIPVVSNLSVGDNFMDHFAFLGFVFTTNQSKSPSVTEVLGSVSNYLEYYLYGNGPLTVAGPAEIVAFLSVNDTTGVWPDIETYFGSVSPLVNREIAQSSGITEDVYQDYFEPYSNVSTYQCFPSVLRPRSRGRVRLNGTDVLTKPLIDPFFSIDEDDFRLLAGGMRKAIEHSMTPAMQKIGSRLIDIPFPLCADEPYLSDAYWKCAMLRLPISFRHKCGTCKMGPADDSNAVVDPTLKVYGIGNLRVVDASIFPVIPSGHLEAPTCMVAEKAADLIKQDHL